MSIVSLGLWGNEQSRNWKGFHLKEGEILKGFRIRHGAVIEGITFILNTSEVSVGQEGGNSEEVEFNIASGEYITQISGTSTNYPSRNDGRCITSMTIYTSLNKNGYGTYGLGRNKGKYGVEDGSFFSTPTLCSDAIVGFYGGANQYLESIGIFINPAPAKFGPWGYLHEWYFMLENQILKEIKIRHGRVIDGIAFRAADNNSMTRENTYGGRGGRIDEIVLNTQENEYLTQITGFMGNYNDMHCISSLTFYTNLKPDGYGPYGLGREEGNSGVKNVSFFSTPLVSHNAIVGFHGTANRYLESIGVFISPVGTSVGGAGEYR